MLATKTLVFSLSLTLVSSRDIIFPTLPSYPTSEQAQQLFHGYGVDDDLFSAFDVPFKGLTTFANLPYVHCLNRNDDTIEKYDVAIMGAGFDTVYLPPHPLESIESQ